MPGQYVVVARPPGTLITELVYNNDHQNHVDGRAAGPHMTSPNCMGAYGISLSQYQLAEDPFPGSVESLAPSLAGEITRLRFVLAQIISQLSGGAAVNWYDSVTSPAIPIIGARVQTLSTLTIPKNSETIISFSGGAIDFNTGVYNDMTQPTRFTAPGAGKYLAFCAATWAAAAGGVRRLRFGVNGTFGTNATISNLSATGVVSQPQSLTGLVDLQANDYVQFAAFQNSGSGINLVADGFRSIVGGIVFLGSA